MKILNMIQLQNSWTSCGQCNHFKNDPAFIEAVYPGLTAMSSGYASVRNQDGLCSRHEIYLAASDSCPHFVHAFTVDKAQNKQ